MHTGAENSPASVISQPSFESPFSSGTRAARSNSFTAINTYAVPSPSPRRMSLSSVTSPIDSFSSSYTPTYPYVAPSPSAPLPMNASIQQPPQQLQPYPSPMQSVVQSVQPVQFIQPPQPVNSMHSIHSWNTMNSVHSMNSTNSMNSMQQVSASASPKLVQPPQPSTFFPSVQMMQPEQMMQSISAGQPILQASAVPNVSPTSMIASSTTSTSPMNIPNASPLGPALMETVNMRIVCPDIEMLDMNRIPPYEKIKFGMKDLEHSYRPNI